MRISDWSSDVCSSDLAGRHRRTRARCARPQGGGLTMPEWLTSMEPHWMWLSVGVLLAAAEIVAPGFFLIWIGAAAIVTGVVAWLVPIGVPVQLGAFAVQIGRAHVCTPVTNAHLVCRLLLATK